jgi:hypothetical protein
VVLERFCKITSEKGDVAYDYTIPMLIFAAFAALSLLVAVMLKREDKKRGYGLEKPNASKH